MREAVLNSNSPVKIYLLSILLAATAGMLLVLQIKSLFFFMGFFVLLGMFIYLLNSPTKGIILFLSSKCIFDMSWFIKIPLGSLCDLNIQKILGLLFPIMILGIYGLKKLNYFPAFRIMLGKLILLYVAFNLLAVVLAENTSRALVVFSKMWGSYILFFICGTILITQKDLRKLCHYFLLFLWIPLGIAFSENLGLISFSSFIENTGYVLSSWGEIYATRLVGLYSHPFDVVRYLVVALPLTLWMLSTEKSPFRSLFYKLNILFLFLAMWRTFYRTGWIIFALQLVFWLKLRKRHKTMLAVILMLVFIVSMNLNFFANFYESLMVLFSPSDQNILSAFSGRFVIWSFHLAKFARSPLYNQLLGHGLASDVSIYYEMSDVLSPTRQSNHSDFIRNLSDTGISGLAIYLLILLLLGGGLLSYIKHEENPSWRGFGQAVFLIFIGFVLLSNVADPSLNPSISWYLWGFAGIVIGRKFLNDKWREQRGRT